MSYFEHEALLGEPIRMSKNSITSTEEIVFSSSQNSSVFLILLLLRLFLLKCGFHAHIHTFLVRRQETWTKHVFVFVPSLLRASRSENKNVLDLSKEGDEHRALSP